jgi:hypothetical protein
MASTRKSRNLSRMIARSSVIAYTPKRRPANDYVVEHRGSHAHLAGERCAICERQKGDTQGKGRSEIVR